MGNIAPDHQCQGAACERPEAIVDFHKEYDMWLCVWCWIRAFRVTARIANPSTFNGDFK